MGRFVGLSCARAVRFGEVDGELGPLILANFFIKSFNGLRGFSKKFFVNFLSGFAGIFRPVRQKNHLISVFHGRRHGLRKTKVDWNYCFPRKQSGERSWNLRKMVFLQTLSRIAFSNFGPFPVGADNKCR